MNRVRYFALAFIVLSGFIIATSRSAPPETKSKETLRDYMQLKLTHSQEILKGLALEDYGAIAKNAQDLSTLSRGETWNVMQTEEFLQHSAEFRRAADAMRDAAKKKNIDGAALAYMETTMKCVNCHKYVRGVRIAQLGLPNSRDTKTLLLDKEK
jgi:hypothetical protein